jgi:hypothetical protein
MPYSFARFGTVTLAATFALGVTGAPALAHDDDNDDNNVYLDRTVDVTAQDSCTPGFLWQGAGNPATTFQRKRNVDAGVELAIKAIVRQGPDISSTYVDRNGLVHIEVPSGAQPGNPARAAWNFTYSYDVALDPGNPTLDRYEAELWIDLDPSDRTDYLKLDLARLGPAAAAGPCPREADTNGLGWKSRSAVIIPDDEGTDRVTQNSQNLAFYASQIDTNRRQRGIQPYTFGPGQFDVVMTIKKKNWHHGHDDRTTLHVVFDVVDAPSQTP